MGNSQQQKQQNSSPYLDKKQDIDYHSSGSLIRKIQEGSNTELPIISVVVTVCGGSSYDQLFDSVKQVSKDGRVVVYQIQPECESLILKKFKQETLPSEVSSTDVSLLNELFENIDAVEPEAVVFNYECCQVLSQHQYRFPYIDITYELTKVLIDRKSMVMFAHYSIMALVNTWDSNRLGTAPFVSIGNGSGNLCLKFKPKTLIDCPSAQLQRVGELCDNGTCLVNGYTCYSVDQKKIGSHQDYSLEILTYITNEVGTVNHKSLSDNLISSIDGEKSVPCHTILTYPSGGVLLASNAHWLDLSNLDVSVEKILKNSSTNI